MFQKRQLLIEYILNKSLRKNHYFFRFFGSYLEKLEHLLFPHDSLIVNIQNCLINQTKASNISHKRGKIRFQTPSEGILKPRPNAKN